MKILKTALLLAFIIFTLSSAASAAPVGWYDDVQITDLKRGQLAAGADICLQNDAVYLVFQSNEKGSQDVLFTYSKTQGKKWEAPVAVVEGKKDEIMPAIYASRKNIFIVWVDERDGNKEIYMRKSSDNGLNWDREKRITNTPGASISPKIAVYENNVYVLWCNEDADGVYRLYMAASEKNGDAFSAPELVVDSVYGVYSPALCLQDKTLYLSWQEKNDADKWDVYLARKGLDNKTWSFPEKVSNISENSYSPDLSVAEDGTIYAVWQGEDDEGSWKIFFRECAEEDWGVEQILSFDLNNMYSPAVGASGGFVYVAWYDFRAGNNELVCKKSKDRGLSWDDDLQLTSAENDSINPVMFSAPDAVYLAWEDARSGAGNIFFKRSDNAAEIPVVSSATHPEGIKKPLGAVKFEWKLKEKDASGIKGFAFTMDTNPYTVPSIMAVTDKTMGWAYPRVPDGTYYFHIRTIDGAENFSAVAHYKVVVDRSLGVRNYETHMVKDGETIYSIAKKYYADEKKFEVILDYNLNLMGPDDLAPSMKLRIPIFDKE